MSKISIVIPTINEANNLPLLLSDLVSIHKEAEIIIVDSGCYFLLISFCFLHEETGGIVGVNERKGIVYQYVWSFGVGNEIFYVWIVRMINIKTRAWHMQIIIAMDIEDST